MLSHDFTPSPPLQAFISRFRIRHFVFETGFTPNCKPFPPRAEQHIVFYPCGYEEVAFAQDTVLLKRPQSIVTGHYSQRLNRYASHPEFLMVEVNLKPGALFKLTGVPCAALVNKEVDAEAFFGNEIKNVNHRLNSTRHYPEMISIIEDFFTQLINQSKRFVLPFDGLLEAFTLHQQFTSVAEMAKTSCLSRRQLERTFNERVGIAPGLLLRIMRFNQAYWLKLKRPDFDGLRIAVACGYTDYQHMAKDFREFADTSPNKFFAEEKMAPGRVLGLTK